MEKQQKTTNEEEIDQVDNELTEDSVEFVETEIEAMQAANEKLTAQAEILQDKLLRQLAES
jgi:hypothetical protein